MKKIFKNARGMTLIEIMVVIAILGLIATMVTVNVMSNFDKAKVDTTRTQIKSLEQALEQYRLDNGSYPTTEQGLSALVTAPSGDAAKRFQPGGYIKKVPQDTWRHDYSYVSPGAQGHPYEVSSLGPDGQEGTDDDIKSSQD